MKYTLKKYEESLNHFKEQVCKHCCEWNKSLRHCNTCVTATAKEALQMAIEAMEKQATSNYTSEWIPVSERLPEGENMYMSPITIMQGEMKMRLEGEIMKAIAGYEIDVDRDELIKALNYDRQQYEKGYKDGLNKSNEWIPCDKHLPEDENEVLITVNGKLNNIIFDNAIEKGFYNEDDGWIVDGYLDWITPEVTAWQPCPEPYKGE